MGIDTTELDRRVTSHQGGGNADDPSISNDGEDEEAWVTEIQQGSEAAFEALFRRYYPELCSFAVSFVGSFDKAREVVQIVLMKLWERREKWHIHSTLRGYLYRAVRNQGLSYARQEERRRSVSLDTNAGVREPFTRDNPEGITSLRDRLRVVQEAIEQLPERQRSAFTLHRRHGLSYKEIAVVMDISPRTVEVHIATALKSLRKIDGRP